MQQTLKSRLQQDTALLCPGVYDAFTAAMAAEAGYESIYLSGAGLAYTLLGKPDIGLLSLHEVADVLFRIRERVDLPIVCDGDTGWGNAINVQRTIRVLERAGASAMQMEDQGFPKRCGHLKGKNLISTGEMVGKIHAALDARDKILVIARTDAIAVEGFERALDRGEAYLEAGADVVFVEAPETREHLEGIVKRFGRRVPLMANMIEGGRTPLLSVDELGAMGYRLVIFPAGVVRAIAKTVQEYYAVLKANGTSASMMPRMFDFVGLNEVIGTERILAAGRAYEPAEKKAAE